MEQSITDYFKTQEAELTLLTLLNITSESNSIEKLTPEEVSIFSIHLQKVLRDAVKFESETPTKGGLFLASLYISKVVNDYISKKVNNY